MEEGAWSELQIAQFHSRSLPLLKWAWAHARSGCFACLKACFSFLRCCWLVREASRLEVAGFSSADDKNQGENNGGEIIHCVQSSYGSTLWVRMLFLLRRSQISCHVPWGRGTAGAERQRISIHRIYIDKSIRRASQKAAFSPRQRAAVCCWLERCLWANKSLSSFHLLMRLC